MDPQADKHDYGDQDHDDPGARGEFGNGRDRGHRAGEAAPSRLMASARRQPCSRWRHQYATIAL